ncbi:MAG: ABC transporter permease [Promicromonosporaceae bacterium]|nr:ABC transporter permease [Promicromonosporaceae bacterium]
MSDALTPTPPVEPPPPTEQDGVADELAEASAFDEALNLGAAEPEVTPEAEEDNRWREAAREILSGRLAVAFGAVILAFLVGSLLIVFTNSNVQAAMGGDGNFFSAAGSAIIDAYDALIRGSIWNWQGRNFNAQILPLTRTLRHATPLIAAGLGVAVTFKAGLFNIGGRGQMIFGAIGSGWLAFGLRDAGIPFPLHLLICIIGGMLAGALWGALAGFLKAKTGAHEVIVTIMLNFVAYHLLQYLLATPGLMQDPARFDPITPPIPGSARLPALYSDLNWGFVISLLLVAACWWLLNRSTAGFAFRAVGENPRAAKVAGINVARTTVIVFAVSGALIGFAGAHQVLDPASPGGFGDTIDGGIGFDAITVALLGGSSPVGVLFAGILFGAFRAGGVPMQAQVGVPAEIATIIQILIVMFIAAPPLVRAIFRLPQPSQAAKAKKDARKTQKTITKAARLTAKNNEEVVSE